MIPAHCAPTPDAWKTAGVCPECAALMEARISELEEVLDRMRRDGCGNWSPIRSGEFENCREKFPGEPDEWCWSCQAHEALSS